MRHNIKSKKLNRTSSHRTALLKNASLSLLEHERITTTVAKAKFLRPHLEKLITIAKGGTLHHRRQLLAKLGNNTAIVEKAMTTLATRYSKRPGGYCRIYKAGFRFGDNAPIAIIELVDREGSTPDTSKRRAGSKKKQADSKQKDAPAAAAE